MCHLEKEHRLHFILYLLALLDMRNITADCYYLLPEVYDLGLNLEISFRIFRLENAVYFLILITFSLLLVQINQMSPEIWHRTPSPKWKCPVLMRMSCYCYQLRHSSFLLQGDVIIDLVECLYLARENCKPWFSSLLGLHSPLFLRLMSSFLYLLEWVPKSLCQSEELRWALNQLTS